MPTKNGIVGRRSVLRNTCTKVHTRLQPQCKKHELHSHSSTHLLSGRGQVRCKCCTAEVISARSASRLLPVSLATRLHGDGDDLSTLLVSPGQSFAPQRVHGFVRVLVLHPGALRSQLRRWCHSVASRRRRMNGDATRRAASHPFLSARFTRPWHHKQVLRYASSVDEGLPSRMAWYTILVVSPRYSNADFLAGCASRSATASNWPEPR